MDKIYLISPLAQKEESQLYCFKECGKILVGGVIFMDAPWLPCKQEKCPHLDKELNMDEGEFDDIKYEVVVRRLTPITPNRR